MHTLEQRIKDLNSEIQAYARRHAGDIGSYFDQSSDALAEVRDARLGSIGDTLPVPPALVPSEVADRFGRCHEALRQALDLIFDARLGGSWSRLAEVLRLQEPTFRYVDTTRRPRWMTIGRPDVVIHDDSIAIVEPNVGSSCGSMPDADILGRLFENSPTIGGFLSEIGARRTDAVAVLAAYLKERLAMAGESADARVVIAEFKAELVGRCDECDPISDDCEALARELGRHGIRAEVAAVEDLDVTGSGVAYDGERCGVVYRVAGEEPDPEGHYPFLAPILEAGRRGKVIVVDELDDAIAVNKTILATVSEELDADRLPAQIKRHLAGFIPWSRVLGEMHTEVAGVRVDLPAWCLNHREQLVLKPGAGYCGRGVTIGCETEQADWETAMNEAMASTEAWMVQRLARSAPTTVTVDRCGVLASEETFVDYGYFAIGGTVPAAILRKSAPFGNPTRRVKRGGQGPVFVV